MVPKGPLADIPCWGPEVQVHQGRAAGELQQLPENYLQGTPARRAHAELRIAVTSLTVSLYISEHAALLGAR